MKETEAQLNEIKAQNEESNSLLKSSLEVLAELQTQDKKFLAKQNALNKSISEIDLQTSQAISEFTSINSRSIYYYVLSLSYNNNTY